MCKTVQTKKVYRPRHAERKARAYKRDKSSNRLNPLDYVCSSGKFVEWEEAFV